MSLTPRGASDVPPTLDAFEKALRDYADAITNWSACTGGFVDVAAMRRHILESGALVVSMFDALTTRSAALEADKAELLARLDEVTGISRGIIELSPNWSMPVASPPSKAPESAVDALGEANE